jgi:hypothetical protein
MNLYSTCEPGGPGEFFVEKKTEGRKSCDTVPFNNSWDNRQVTQVSKLKYNLIWSAINFVFMANNVRFRRAPDAPKQMQLGGQFAVAIFKLQQCENQQERERKG